MHNLATMSAPHSRHRIIAGSSVYHAGMTLAETLDRYGLTERDIEEVFRSEIAAAGTMASLTADEMDVLARFGGIAAPERHRPEASKRLARAAVATAATLAATSITPQDVARRLGISPSRVHHRVGDKALYAYRAGGRLRLPLWQFDDAGDPLPGLRSVIAALPEGLHPLEVQGLMTNPGSDLTIGGAQCSPRDWLIAGGDVAAVVGLAASLDAW